MLALDVLEGFEERLCLLGRQAVIPEASDERALLDDVTGSVLDGVPDHLKFSFASTRRDTIIDGPGAGGRLHVASVTKVAHVATRSISL